MPNARHKPRRFPKHNWVVMARHFYCQDRIVVKRVAGKFESEEAAKFAMRMLRTFFDHDTEYWLLHESQLNIR